MDAAGLRRSAAEGDSSMLTTSGVSRMRTRRRSIGYAMRGFGLVTVRALAEAGGLQRVVRAPLRRACLRMSSFWIWHRDVSVLTSQFLQRGEPRIQRFLSEVARPAIQVRPADRAQPLA